MRQKVITGDPRIIVALDYPDPAPALALADRLDPARCRLKIGKELFTRAGPSMVAELERRGFGVFLDLKFHDIPNTVAGACAAAAELGVWMLNVHASGGRRMMESARQAVEQYHPRPLLIAVTILTSLSDTDLRDVGLQGGTAENVLRLAALAQDCGLDGVVCSPRECAALRHALGKEFVLVTPGIRPSGAPADDQQRVMTPSEALREGADYLVVGRPVTMADNPLGVLLTLESEISALT
ncbi:MAG: orotidine-5'-phosphate decarboxylase [Gammaproteobacteria bacterium]|nr:orotidine-5'-phosphate decarboxylase [Gammaproteobacteria bacterium]